MVIFLIIHLILIVPVYLFSRYSVKKSGERWSKSMRAIAILFSILPIFNVAAIVISLLTLAFQWLTENEFEDADW